MPCVLLNQKACRDLVLVPVLSCIIPIITIINLNIVYIDRVLILSYHLHQDNRSNFLRLNSMYYSHALELIILRSFVTHIHMWVRASKSRANASGNIYIYIYIYIILRDRSDEVYYSLALFPAYLPLNLSRTMVTISITCFNITSCILPHGVFMCSVLKQLKRCYFCTQPELAGLCNGSCGCLLRGRYPVFRHAREITKS